MQIRKYVTNIIYCTIISWEVSINYILNIIRLLAACVWPHVESAVKNIRRQANDVRPVI